TYLPGQTTGVCYTTASSCNNACYIPPTPTPIPPPTCSGSCAPQSSTTYDASGTFYAYAYGVSNATMVKFPTWSDPGGQDDLVWYDSTNLGGGTLRAAINLASHPGIGTINVHIYMDNNGYSNQWCCSANFTRLAVPSTPVGTCGTFNTTNATTPVTWTWGNGTGIQVWDSTGYWWYNSSASSPLTISGIPPGRIVSARTTYNYTDFSTVGTVTCPLPANQTTVVNGVLRQRSGTGCYQADSSNNFNILTLIGSTGDSCVTVAPCTFSLDKQHAVSYSCTVTWDNQACVALGRQPNTAQTLSINTFATGYSSGQFSNASCALNGTTLPITAGVNNGSADIAFNFSGNNWYKLKSTSFIGSSTTGIAVPAFVSQYIPGDVDDDTSKYFIIGDAGSVLNTTVLPSTSYSSSNNWRDSSYPESFSMNSSGFLSYIKSRKEHTKIDDLSKITADGIYDWNGTVPLDITSVPPQFNSFKVVLIVSGTVNINVADFSPTNKSLALLADQINFSNTTTQASGIFIANTINTGNPANQGLKIIGNLIAQTTLTNGRIWSDTSRPSIFIVFDPVQYLNLLPYLSTASYDWRQVQ
ncbi:MAG: GBS Bsp-like repeat-containing protein, partial [Patescibacteria group bacterium]